MQHGAAASGVRSTVSDIQFAGKRGRRIDWRSRPASELERTRAAHAAAITERLEKGLLLDGIR